MRERKLFSEIVSLLSEKYRWYFLFIGLILVVSAVLTQVTPIAIGSLTDSLIDSESLKFGIIIPLLLLILVVNVVNETLKVIRRLMVEAVATSAEKTARNRAADSLLKAPLSYFRKHMTGNIHGRLNRSIEGTVKLIKLMFMDFVPSVCTGLVAVGVMFYKLPPMIAGIGVLVVPIGTAIVFRQIKTQKGIRVELMETKAEMDGTVVELLGGIETIRSLDSADAEGARIEQKSDYLRNKEMRHHKAMAAYDFLKFVNEAVFHVLMIGLSVYFAAMGKITVGTILTAYLCFNQLTGPLRELHRILDEFSEGLVLAKDYFKLIHIPPDFSFEVTEEAVLDELKDHSIQIQKISLAYDEKPDQKILSDLSLYIADGEFVGMAGPSGCGKSSLIKALDRLEKIQGTITIGGMSIERLSRSAMSGLVSLVPQSPFLISDTVYHNICYGMKREVSMEEVREAAKRAYIDTTIEQFPGAYDYMLSEGGRNLSGGQRQRIALARIFLQKPKILILDEATSALDNHAEKFVMEQVRRMQKENHMTVIAIAHRLSSLQWCDSIVVMEKGVIVQQGSYEILANTKGVFQTMLKHK